MNEENKTIHALFDQLKTLPEEYPPALFSARRRSYQEQIRKNQLGKFPSKEARQSTSTDSKPVSDQ
jgi:hypothetical protein